MKIVTGPYEILINIAKARGYSEEEIQGCILSREDKICTVDVDHEAYPMYPKQNTPEHNISKNQQKITLERNTGGVGTELKKLLSKIGIVATPNCSCNARAKLMDNNGIEWCENNQELIIDWLREEARKRGMPFIDLAGKTILKRAIHNAKKVSVSHQ